MDYDLQKLRIAAKARLSEKRYLHCLAVEERAVFLAKRYGQDEKRAQIAGLLHDICNAPPYEEQLKIITAHGILLDDFTMLQPKLWHAIAGSIYIEEQLGIADPEIICAVRWHTTGHKDMTALEQVVYLADLTGADRDFPDIKTARALSEQSLGAGMHYSLRYITRMLLDEGKPIVRDAWEAYNYFLCGSHPTILQEDHI